MEEIKDIQQTPEWIAGYQAGYRDRGPTGFPLDDPEESRQILLGAYVIMGVRIPVQRIYMHPATLANIFRKLREDQLVEATEPDPLTPEMEKEVADYEKLMGLVLR